MKKLLFVIGTRPEAIKLAPLIHQAQRTASPFIVKIVVTGQHSSLLPSILSFFDLHIDYSLSAENTSLSSFVAQTLVSLESILLEERVDLVIVQGDTSSAYVGALAAFYQKIPIAHIEAGLRTFEKYSPFPEELNRVMISRMADFHFAPTTVAANQLSREGIDPTNICESGNTVIDALYYTKARILQQAIPTVEKLQQMLYPLLAKGQPLVLVTVHRRENIGANLITICEALKAFAKRGTHQLVFPVHPNPAIKQPIHHLLGDISNIMLLEALPYEAFVYLLLQVGGILTDSGGIQEEATALGIPTIVLRTHTERSEALSTQIIRLCEINHTSILKNLEAIDGSHLVPQSTFGDGHAAKYILAFLTKKLRAGQ